MRKNGNVGWLAFVLGGVGIAIARNEISKIFLDALSSFDEGQRRIGGWNEAAQSELARIQQTLHELRQSIVEMQAPEAVEQI